MLWTAKEGDALKFNMRANLQQRNLLEIPDYHITTSCEMSDQEGAPRMSQLYPVVAFSQAATQNCPGSCSWRNSKAGTCWATGLQPNGTSGVF